MVQEPKPYQDQGVAWLSVIVAFMMNLLVGGTIKSFGVIYVGLLDTFEAGESVTSLINVVNMALSSLFCLLAGYLSDKMSLRILLMIGATLSLAGFTISAFSPTIYYTIVGYGGLVGIGTSFLLTSGNINLARFWNKRKSLANGIAFSGTATGTLVLPLVYTAMINEFAVRGTLLLAGGFWFQMCVFSMLVRKAEVPKPRTIKKGQTKADGLKTVSNEIVLSPKALENGLSETKPEGHIKPSFFSSEIDQNEKKITTNNNSTADGSVQTIFENGNRSKQIPISKENRTPTQCEELKSMMTNIYFMRLIIMMLFGTSAAYVILFMLPALAKERGAEEFIASLTVTITGATEVITRLTSGYLIDRFQLNKTWFWSTANLICAGSGLVAASVDTVYSVMVLAVFLGMTGTILVPLLLPLMSDYLPPSQIGRGSGMITCTFSAGAAIGYAIVGEASEQTGTFVTPLVILSSVFVLVSFLGFLDIIVILIKKCYNKISGKNSVTITKM